MGIIANPLCVAHLKMVCAGVFSCFFAMVVMVGCSNRGGVSWDFFQPSSRVDDGPKVEYAVTASPCSLASFRRFS